MKYLDDRITFYIDGYDEEYGSPIEGINTYRLYRYFPHPIPTRSKELVFVGNFYHDGSNGKTFDVTDIIRSLKEKPSDDVFTDGYSGETNTILVDRYYIEWDLNYIGVPSTLSSNWQTVAMIYRYPNYSNTDNFSNGNNVIIDTFATGSGSTSVPLQGYVDEYELTPHYPLKRTDVYKYVQSFLLGRNVASTSLKLDNDNTQYARYIIFSGGTLNKGTLFTASIDDFLGSSDFWGLGDLEVSDSNGDVIAILDSCYKRYYLMWQDRFGGIQSQAFNDYATYSESYDVTETQNYRNERSKSLISVQPKWKINSGWINERLYPLYESIYVSPILYLYDSKEDKLYNVMVSGDYVEKTYKNEKKLLNINLDLQLNAKQNILY